MGKRRVGDVPRAIVKRTPLEGGDHRTQAPDPVP